jgi:hypothetical protein
LRKDAKRNDARVQERCCFSSANSSLFGHSAEFREANGRSLSASPCCDAPSPWLRDADVASDLFAQATAHGLDHDFALRGASRVEAIP